METHSKRSNNPALSTEWRTTTLQCNRLMHIMPHSKLKCKLEYNVWFYYFPHAKNWMIRLLVLNYYWMTSASILNHISIVTASLEQRKRNTTRLDIYDSYQLFRLSLRLFFSLIYVLLLFLRFTQYIIIFSTFYFQSSGFIVPIAQAHSTYSIIIITRTFSFATVDRPIIEFKQIVQTNGYI